MNARAAPRARGRGRSRGASVRRRAFAVLVIAGLVVAGVAVVAPMLHRAVREVTLPLRHEDIIRQQARDKRLDPALVAGVIFAESKFRDQTSATGAKGLMQIQPETAKFIARRSGGAAFEIADLGTPQINIQYGTYYLRYLLDRYGENVVLAVAAYNGGETNVDRWIAESGRRGKAFKINDIPFPETRAYVNRVLDAERKYRREYSSELGL
jgi:soluble lytic murein transglycosylase